MPPIPRPIKPTPKQARRTNQPKLLPPWKCKACGGTGRSSKGTECYPCVGTGKFVEKKP